MTVSITTPAMIITISLGLVSNPRLTMSTVALTDGREARSRRAAPPPSEGPRDRGRADSQGRHPLHSQPDELNTEEESPSLE